MQVEIRTDLPAKFKRERRRTTSMEPHEAKLSPNGAIPEPMKVQAEGETSASASASLVELEVVKIPPNPRLVICRYWVLGEERRCTVSVGRNCNFVPKMKFWIPEPGDPTTRVKPWAYTGRLPKRRGRW
jgi:hypothetical protein